MITLTQGQSLALALGGVITTSQCPYTVGFTEGPGLGRQEFQQDQGITASASTVTVVNGVSEQRRIDTFSFFNADTAQVTVTLSLVDLGQGNQAAGTRTIVAVTIQTLESLHWSTARGFYVLDINGQQKTNIAAASSTVSTADSKAVLASSQASSTTSSLAAVLIPASLNSVSSQASSMALANPGTVSSIMSVLSVASFTNTTWSTISSATSRVKSSFTW